MASKTSLAMALFLALNLLFFSMASATCPCGPSTPKPTPGTPHTPKPSPSTPHTPKPTPSTPKPTPGTPHTPKPTPSTPKPTPSPPHTPKPTPSTPTPTPSTPSTPTPTTPSTPPSGGSGGNCPIDALRLGVCADVLSSLLNVNLGSRPPVQPCCSLINGLVDLDAAICLCTAIRANVLGINLNVPVSLSLLLNVCNKEAPSGFQCPT